MVQVKFLRAAGFLSHLALVAALLAIHSLQGPVHASRAAAAPGSKSTSTGIWNDTHSEAANRIYRRNPFVRGLVRSVSRKIPKGESKWQQTTGQTPQPSEPTSRIKQSAGTKRANTPERSESSNSKGEFDSEVSKPKRKNEKTPKKSERNTPERTGSKNKLKKGAPEKEESKRWWKKSDNPPRKTKWKQRMLESAASKVAKRLPKKKRRQLNVAINVGKLIGGNRLEGCIGLAKEGVKFAMPALLPFGLSMIWSAIFKRDLQAVPQPQLTTAAGHTCDAFNKCLAFKVGDFQSAIIAQVESLPGGFRNVISDATRRLTVQSDVMPDATAGQSTDAPNATLIQNVTALFRNKDADYGFRQWAHQVAKECKTDSPQLAKACLVKDGPKVPSQLPSSPQDFLRDIFGDVEAEFYTVINEAMDQEVAAFNEQSPKEGARTKQTGPPSKG